MCPVCVICWAWRYITLRDSYKRRPDCASTSRPQNRGHSRGQDTETGDCPWKPGTVPGNRGRLVTLPQDTPVGADTFRNKLRNVAIRLSFSFFDCLFWWDTIKTWGSCQRCFYLPCFDVQVSTGENLCRNCLSYQIYLDKKKTNYSTSWRQWNQH